MPRLTGDVAERADADTAFPPVHVVCLGDFRVVVDGQPLDQCSSGKARALFQYLLIHANRPLPRELLIETLWPDPDADAAGTSLRVAVHALRQLLSSESGYDSLTVRAHSAGYQLTVAGLRLDVDEFVAACSRGHQLLADGHPLQAANAYSEAVDLYGGDFLEGATEAWAVVRREGLKDQYLLALERLAQAALEADDYAGCLLYAQRLVEQDRCRESAYRLLMTCHARFGQRGRVRAWYDLCVQTLRSELGVEPDEATTAVYRAALGTPRSDP